MKTLLLDADENFGWEIVRRLTSVREVVECGRSFSKADVLYVDVEQSQGSRNRLREGLNNRATTAN